MHAQYQKIAEKYALEFYDFNLYREYSYEALTDFSNANHMSLAGAVDFTQDYLDVVGLVDNGQDVSELFYDSYQDIAQVLYQNILTR